MIIAHFSLFALFYFLICFRGESTHPFCDKVKRDPLETDCTDDRNSVALCNLVEYNTELPPIYQVSKHLLEKKDVIYK